MRPLRASLLLISLAAVAAAAPARAAGGYYATTGTGTGTYAQSLWWLDFTGYSNTTAAGGGQAYSFTLPNGAGTLSTTVALSGSGTLTAVATPAWTGGAIGHGAYNGIAGSPDFYWIGQSGIGTVALKSIIVKDAAGNARSFSLYTADGENTNSGESITYTSTAAWKLIDTVNYYAGYNGGVPALAGTGSTSVVESAPASNDNTYNASVILGTQSPTQVSAALSGNEAVMFAVALPTVTLTVNVASRVSSTDQFTASVAYTSPSSSLKTVSSSGTAGSATTGAVSAIGANGVTLGVSMLTGSASPLSYYTGSIACTNGGPGASGYGGTNTALPSGAGTSFAVTPQVGDAIACTLTVTPVGHALTGTVYLDANHDAALDNGETGTSLAGLYVKLAPSSAGVCQSPATSAAAVSATTGTYSVSGVAPGNYCLILTNSNVLANTTAYSPSGYVATEGASGRALSVSISPTPVQNFGLFAGSTVSAVVFGDTGNGGGTANDGIQNGGEAGIGNVLLTASAAGTSIATASTAASGGALLWLPSTAQGTMVTLTPTAPNGDKPTGGSVGTSGGSYTRPSLSFTLVSGQTYTGIGFGLVPSNTFASNGAQAVGPGGTVYYPHTFTAATAGQVTFSSSANPSPVQTWSEVLYLDTACTGQFGAGDTLITAPITATAGQSICILVREFAPATAPANATDKITVSAAFLYSGAAAPAAVTLTLTDLTTVSGSGNLLLTKRVQNVTAATAYATEDNALPGQTLQYQLTASNQGATAISALVVNDVTPAYSTFLAGSCPMALPAGLSSCALSAQPTVGGTGAVQWTFAGTLAAGAQIQVTFQVLVAP